MNATKKAQPGKDPELLRVKLAMFIDYPDRDSDIGPVVELENDGVTTKFAYGPEPEDFRLILQTRSAFRADGPGAGGADEWRGGVPRRGGRG